VSRMLVNRADSGFLALLKLPHPIFSAQLRQQNRPRPKSPGEAKYSRHPYRSLRH
jgi:hypothetical protein